MGIYYDPLDNSSEPRAAAERKVKLYSELEEYERMRIYSNDTLVGMARQEEYERRHLRDRPIDKITGKRLCEICRKNEFDHGISFQMYGDVHWGIGGASYHRQNFYVLICKECEEKHRPKTFKDAAVSILKKCVRPDKFGKGSICATVPRIRAYLNAGWKFGSMP